VLLLFEKGRQNYGFLIQLNKKEKKKTILLFARFLLKPKKNKTKPYLCSSIKML